MRRALIPNFAAVQLVGPFFSPVLTSSNFVTGNAQEPRNELSPLRLSGTRVASKRCHTRMLPLLASASREGRDINENKLRGRRGSGAAAE